MCPSAAAATAACGVAERTSMPWHIRIAGTVRVRVSMPTSPVSTCIRYSVPYVRVVTVGRVAGDVNDACNSLRAQPAWATEPLTDTVCNCAGQRVLAFNKLRFHLGYRASAGA